MQELLLNLELREQVFLLGILRLATTNLLNTVSWEAVNCDVFLGTSPMNFGEWLRFIKDEEISNFPKTLFEDSNAPLSTVLDKLVSEKTIDERHKKVILSTWNQIYILKANAS